MDDKRSLPLAPLWLVAPSAVGIGGVVAAAFLSGGAGHATVVVPWFIPADLSSALISCSRLNSETYSDRSPKCIGSLLRLP